MPLRTRVIRPCACNAQWRSCIRHGVRFAESLNGIEAAALFYLVAMWQLGCWFGGLAALVRIGYATVY